MKNIYTSVDIGSDAIKVVVCEQIQDKLYLLAASSVKSKGIKKGLITNINEATESLKQAFDEIEVMLGVKINKVIASIPAYFAKFTYTKGEIKINNENGIVTGDDIIKVLHIAMKSKMKPDKELVTMIPIDFSLDNQPEIKDPKGLTGSILETRAIMVTTPKKNIYSVVGLIESLGIEVVDISLNCIGDIYAFKNKEIEEQIGAIINIGAETTSVSLYNKGIIVKNSIIQLGGRNIDNDIAYIYKVSHEVARKTKEKFALAHKRYASVNDIFEVSTSYDEKLKINQFEVSEIVMSRIEEILTLSKKEINILTNKKIQYIIITGGTSNIAHFHYIADDVLGKEVKIGNIKLTGVRHNKYSSAIGNIIYFINKLQLKGIEDYSMFSKNDVDDLSSTRKGLLNISNESMLGKVFGYFWSE